MIPDIGTCHAIFDIWYLTPVLAMLYLTHDTRHWYLTCYTYTCYARHLTSLYVLAGLRLTTLNSHVQILETGPWRPCCNRSECAADPSVTIGVQQKLGHRCSSSSQLFSCLALEATLAVSWASLSFYYVYPFMYCTFISSGDVIFL